jgi:C_GCAxxG_C_C family probable redox protein
MKKILDDNILCEKAMELFWDEYNCSQSVLSVYSDFLQIDKETSLSISRGFGGGMGRLQGTCGAVTAAYIIFGFVNSSADYGNQIKTSKTYSMIQKFHDSFIKKNGTTNCKELLNCDLKTEEGQNYFKTENLKKNVCEACIRDSIKLINAAILR